MTVNLTAAEKDELRKLENLHNFHYGTTPKQNERRIQLGLKYTFSPEGKANEAAFVDSIDR
jgi:hypothetical protein